MCIALWVIIKYSFNVHLRVQAMTIFPDRGVYVRTTTEKKERRTFEVPKQEKQKKQFTTE